MISIDAVSKRFGSFTALDRCTMDVRAGEVVVVCGPSGSGKSTLIKCVNALVDIDEGEIHVDGEKINRRSKNLPKLRSKIGMVFQHFELFPHLSVVENICLGQVRALRRTPSEAAERARALLDRVGLRSQSEKYPAELSGGQQQRVAIARSLAMDPIVMLFDEPTSALDPEMMKEVLDVMRELAHSGMTMVVVTHEMVFARHVAHRVVFMDSGQIRYQAPTAEFFTAPADARAAEFLSRILVH